MINSSMRFMLAGAIKGFYYFTDGVPAVSCRHQNFIVILSKMMNKEACTSTPCSVGQNLYKLMPVFLSC